MDSHKTKPKPCSHLLKQVLATLSSSSTKTLSWSCTTKNKGVKLAPAGCFVVYVGPEKRRFVLMTEFANHALFKGLLADAAMKHGYKNDGPLLLPCDVDLFCDVLREIEESCVEDMISSKCWCLIPTCRPRRLDFKIINKMDHGGAYRLIS